MPNEEEDFFNPVHVPLLSDRPWKMFAGGMHHLILLDEKGECRPHTEVVSNKVLLFEVLW